MKTWSDVDRASSAEIVAWALCQEWARAMAACQQDAEWHAEGDVWTHTSWVLQELVSLPEWQTLDHSSQLKLLFTALFHDAGKPATTQVNPETGRIHSPKHAFLHGSFAQGNTAF